MVRISLNKGGIFGELKTSGDVGETRGLMGFKMERGNVGRTSDTCR